MRKSTRIAALLSGICVAGSLMTGTALATAGEAQGQQIVTTVTEEPMAPATGSTALSLKAASSDAAAACGTYNRVQACQIVNHTTTVFNSRKVPIGELKARSTHALVFNTKSRKFRETITVKVTSIVGRATGLRHTLVVSCGSPCKATNNFPQNRVWNLGQTIKGTISYSDGVKKGKVHFTASTYRWNSFKTGANPSPGATTKSIGYRCDDKISNQSAGCVIPRATPMMTAMKKLPQIAANIRRIQNGSPGHYGKPGSGHPLHRMMNKSQQGKNRRAVCARRVVGAPPRPGVSCDEYPFASTREGGTTLSAKNRGTAWVPAWEQNKQAGYITSSHNTWRTLDGEAFYVIV
ncbi:NucA/NucB deoxyribonuclease domain-containing protein [Spirillospora sp. NPDC049652]